MVAARHELVEPQSEVEIDLVTEAEFDEVVGLLAGAFGAPAELFASLNRLIAVLDGISWYLGRVDGVIVATAVGAVADDAVGIFNVATPSELRGRGYGAALTARAAQEGFDAGAQFAFLQSSELGHGVYRGLGFRDVEEYVLLTRPG
jgi:predicted GNAT family acetyltransferase